MAKRIRRPNGVTPIEWIERSLVPEGECRTWPHATNPRGYGFTSTGRKPGEQDLVHRIVWAGANGPIPSGLVIDHTCYNRRCARLDHLRLVTPSENMENRSGPQKNSTSGVRGVYWNEARRRWIVWVGAGGRNHYGGRYHALDDAERAAVELRLRLHTNPSASDLAYAS